MCCQVEEFLGEAAFSTAIQCKDLASENEKDPDSVCLKIIKNNKDYFDQSLDEIKLLHYINSRGDPEKFHVLRMIDYFYFKEHLFLVGDITSILSLNFNDHGSSSLTLTLFWSSVCNEHNKGIVLELLRFRSSCSHSLFQSSFLSCRSRSC